MVLFIRKIKVLDWWMMKTKQMEMMRKVGKDLEIKTRLRPVMKKRVMKIKASSRQVEACVSILKKELVMMEMIWPVEAPSAKLQMWQLNSLSSNVVNIFLDSSLNISKIRKVHPKLKKNLGMISRRIILIKNLLV